MENIFGKNEGLELHNNEGKLVYRYVVDASGSFKFTYDDFGNTLTYENSDGYSCEYTRDSQGNVLAFENSNGYSYDLSGSTAN